jgi:hypothetical protein
MLSFFELKDPNEKTVDLQNSFLVSATKHVIISKVVLWGLTVSNLIYGWIVSDYPEFHLAFHTHWALIFAAVYESISILPSVGVEHKWLIHLAWVSFSLASVFEMGVALLYWAVEYDRATSDVDYRNLMNHGGVIMLIVWIDGLILN